MPQNKKQSIVYTFMMCFVMVLWMSIYNVSLSMGALSRGSLLAALMGFPLGYVVGMACDWFIVSGIAMRCASHFFIKEGSSQRRTIIAISSCMVIGMVTLMSLYGALEVNVSAGFAGGIQGVLLMWLRNIPQNFIMALPFQLLIAGPLVRKVFGRIAPALA